MFDWTPRCSQSDQAHMIQLPVSLDSTGFSLRGTSHHRLPVLAGRAGVLVAADGGGGEHPVCGLVQLQVQVGDGGVPAVLTMGVADLDPHHESRALS